MTTKRYVTIDGNEATASVAFRLSEVCAIYPITPASPMGELPDEWAARGMTNIWGLTPTVMEMQSEGGASGAVHGSTQAGALSATFTASQGLLLMVPNLFKIAGELSPIVIHVSARTVATHALSIFGDHSDVMACRSTGFALLASSGIQQAHDLACVAHAATLRSRVPFIHFFDGFRTSHEIQKIEMLSDEQLRAMMDEELIAQHRDRAMTPDRPVLRGTAQNPDAFFQAREACNRWYDECADHVQAEMDSFAKVSGRQYHLFDYYGAPDAERVLVAMGSGADTIRDTIEFLAGKGEKVGFVEVRLYRPFDANRFVAALPKTAKKIAVLDRTKEPGALGEPMFLDVLTVVVEAGLKNVQKVIGGRYGLSSKEFTPAMVKAVCDELSKDEPKKRFTVGINDDVTHLSLDYDPSFNLDTEGMTQAMFFGLGSDGTVGANKNSIKIIGEGTDAKVQGYFVYDSKKAGAITVSHLRFGPNLIRAPYLVQQADFVACHQFVFLERYDMLANAKPGSVFLLNSPVPKDRVWDELPVEVQQQIIDKKLRFYVIDGSQVARDAGMGNRINTVMQTCFFAISGVLPKEEAITKIKEAIQKTYGKKGADVVAKNHGAVDAALAHLHEVPVPAQATSKLKMPPVVSPEAPEFVRNVTATMIAAKGDTLPVSAFPPDGTWPLGTTQWEKRNIAEFIPVWDEKICIQCNKCVMVCPHAAIRAKVYDPALLDKAPATFKSIDFKGQPFKGQKYTIQVAPEDCTGCEMCAVICPAKDKANPSHKSLMMQEQRPLREPERDNFEFFLSLPEVDRTKLKMDVKGTAFMQPLFEYSGACAGCGETPYVKLLTQLFGDRALIGNATGCSSIYGGNLPTTPYTTNRDGRGPTWSNSLFEDCAEFGFGFRLAVDAQMAQAKLYVQQFSSKLGDELVKGLLEAHQSDEAGIAAQRERVRALVEKLQGDRSNDAQRLVRLANFLVKKSVWAVGGDGWAYDIGFGGLDHVLASDRDINVLVLDTGVYSNTGGQQSKATPLGAAAKFAAAGREVPRKDLGMIAMAYPNCYVAQVAFGAKDLQTVKAFVEADRHPGPSIIIAYCHCIAHGFDLKAGCDHQKMAVEAGLWPLYRSDPALAAKGEPPLQLDAGGEIKRPVKDFTMTETRFRMVQKLYPERFDRLQAEAQNDANRRVQLYRQLADVRVKPPEGSTS